jgi:hypothetical protein
MAELSYANWRAIRHIEGKGLVYGFLIVASILLILKLIEMWLERKKG